MKVLWEDFFTTFKEQALVLLFELRPLVSPPDETWVGVYTVKDCYPVQETYTRNSSVTTSTRFFSLQLGISDPDVFTPPSTCQSARPQRMAESAC